MQVSEVLAKVVRQQAEVVDLAEKRAEVLSCIEEFEAVRAECRWLNEYEHDEMRYKVGPMSTVSVSMSSLIQPHKQCSASQHHLTHAYMASAAKESIKQGSTNAWSPAKLVA